jgi:hypothetical protein
MEMSQGNSLYSYLKQKCHFLKNEIGEQEGRIGPVWGIGISGRGEDVEKGYRRVNICKILCMHVCKRKNETC